MNPNVVTIIEEIITREVPYTGQTDMDFFTKTPSNSIEKMTQPLMYIIRHAMSDDNIGYVFKEQEDIQKYYVVYSPKVEKFLDTHFSSINSSINKLKTDINNLENNSKNLRSTISSLQTVNTELNTKLKYVKNMTFIQRLKFLFNKKTLLV